jgi:hypothetical protein
MTPPRSTIAVRRSQFDDRIAPVRHRRQDLTCLTRHRRSIYDSGAVGKRKAGIGYGRTAAGVISFLSAFSTSGFTHQWAPNGVRAGHTSSSVIAS